MKRITFLHSSITKVKNIVSSIFRAIGYEVISSHSRDDERRFSTEKFEMLEQSNKVLKHDLAICKAASEARLVEALDPQVRPKNIHQYFNVVPPALRPRQLAFMHIGKTAGTSFHHLIRNALPEALTFNGGPEQYDVMTPEQLEPFDLLLGHFSFHHSMKFRPNKYLLTFLRDPVERVLSNYHFLKSWGGYVDATNEDMIRASRELSLNGFLQSPLPQVRAVVENHQTYFFGSDWRASRTEAPEALFQRARENLHSLQFIGLTERYAESIAMLYDDLGFSGTPSVTRLNVTPERPPADELSPEDRSMIEDLNSLDIRLYEQAKLIFEKRVERFKTFPMHKQVAEGRGQ